MINGRTVKNLREKLGQSQAEFGKSLGVHNTTVSRWERDFVKVKGPLRLLLERMEKEIKEPTDA